MQPVQLEGYGIELTGVGAVTGRLMTIGELNPFLTEGFEKSPYVGIDKLEATCLMERFNNTCRTSGTTKVVPLIAMIGPRNE